MNEINKSAFLEHARSVSPKEACALLIIERGKEKLVICENRSPSNQQFHISAEEYVAAEDRGEIIAVIHSHPNKTSKPSPADRVACNESKLPWLIVGTLNGDWSRSEPDGFTAPLIGRPWAHGVLDCYSIIRDYYLQELKIVLPDFERDFEWWKKDQNLYEENFEKAGFLPVPFDSARKHDVLLMKIKSPVINHGAVFLEFRHQMLHHSLNRLSERTVWGGWWMQNTVKVIRHKELFDEKKDTSIWPTRK